MIKYHDNSAAKILTPILVAFFSLCVALPVAASGLFESRPKAANWAQAATGERVTLTGTVRVVGNAPFTETVITDAKGHDWYMDADGAALLRGMEHKPVTVTGTVERKPMTLANGKSLGDRLLLSKVAVKG